VDISHPEPCNYEKMYDERGRKAIKVSSPLTHSNMRLGGRERERALARTHLNFSKAIDENLNTLNSPLPKLSKSPENPD